MMRRLQSGKDRQRDFGRLYELPNVEGNMGQEEVLSMVKEMGYAPIRIQPLGEAKHIFPISNGT